jgi:hypothetical protein
MAKRKVVKLPKSAARPWTTDYGMSKGHCGSANGAKIAAIKYMIMNDQKHCTIESPQGAVARLSYTSFWGFACHPVRGKATKRGQNVLPFERKARK